MTEQQWVSADIRIRALEKMVAELRQQLKDERQERVAADLRLMRVQHDREWRRNVA
jgi:hypothetical protein